MNSNNFHDLKGKVIAIGQSNAGKSSLLRRFNDESFENYYNYNAGIDFFVKKF